MERNQLLAPNQKGFRPFDGAIENNFVLDRLIAKAKRHKTDLYLVLLDLKNAFGSVPHAVIEKAFDAAGVGSRFGRILKDLYTENITQILTANGVSEDIPIRLGVKQGCPLSGPVFNLVINVIFAAIQLLREELHGLGYADDTPVFEDSLEELQATLGRLCNILDRLGLDLNPDKCKSVHIIPSESRCGDTKVFVGGAEA